MADVIVLNPVFGKKQIPQDILDKCGITGMDDIVYNRKARTNETLIECIQKAYDNDDEWAGGTDIVYVPTFAIEWQIVRNWSDEAEFVVYKDNLGRYVVADGLATFDEVMFFDDK